MSNFPTSARLAAWAMVAMSTGALVGCAGPPPVTRTTTTEQVTTYHPVPPPPPPMSPSITTETLYH